MQSRGATSCGDGMDEGRGSGAISTITIEFVSVGRTMRLKMSKSPITIEQRKGRATLRSTRIPQNLPPIHPGEALADALREAGISANSAAISMGLPPSTLTRIIKGQRNVTAPIALRIARYFGTSPDIWIGIQSYDLEMAKDREGARIEREVRPLV
jgi:addiction module HigA family antidote